MKSKGTSKTKKLIKEKQLQKKETEKVLKMMKTI